MALAAMQRGTTVRQAARPTGRQGAEDLEFPRIAQDNEAMNPL